MSLCRMFPYFELGKWTCPWPCGQILVRGPPICRSTRQSRPEQSYPSCPRKNERTQARTPNEVCNRRKEKPACEDRGTCRTSLDPTAKHRSAIGRRNSRQVRIFPGPSVLVVQACNVSRCHERGYLASFRLLAPVIVRKLCSWLLQICLFVFVANQPAGHTPICWPRSFYAIDAARLSNSRQHLTRRVLILFTSYETTGGQRLRLFTHNLANLALI